MPTSFSPEEWSRIEAILDDVLELHPRARADAIERASAGNPKLRADLEALVAADAHTESFLDTPAADYAAGLVRAASTGEVEETENKTGDRIGPYRIISEIGRGGMGRVLLANRDDGQFDQQVALKIVGGGFPGGGEIMRRFLRERQILARLQHPNIARLLDGGMTPDGRPYFAMEYVDGEPITKYCDTRGLDVDARLDLFIEVCEAVQYAHQNLVVHRDLKPSNTLVTASGQVKLLDFGIAKVLHEDDDAAADATLTRLGSGPMTPEYAAPEQVRGEPVTTATDVYALGALVYHLLTGHGPHQLTKLTAAEVERAITARDVERPSVAVGRNRKSGTEPRRRQLKGDLDTIVMQALQKDPTRRYATAGALVDDLRRYRDRRPIAARRDSARYRAGKFIRRHAIGVAATTLIVLSLVGGLIGTAWQARVASREAAKATEVSRFLASLFAVADPARANASQITARELLDRGAARIETDLAGQPDLQAEMMLLVGRLYRELSVYDRAEPLLQRSLEIRQSLREDEKAAAAKSELARLALEAGKPADAERLHRETLALRRERLGAGHPDVGKTLRGLALALDFQGKYVEAEALQREALTLHQKEFGTDHEEIASDLEGLATILQHRGQLEPAVTTARQVLTMREKLLGPDHLETATAKNNLALMLHQKWELAEAERLYRQVLEFDLRRLGELHSNTATVTNNLAFVLRDRGQYVEAENLFRKALDLDRRLFGAEHYYVATVLGNLAAVLTLEEKYDEAERHFREALAMVRRIYGDNHWQIGSLQGGLAGVLMAKRDPGAEALYRTALSQLERTLSDKHPRLEAVLIGLGRLLTERGDAARAEPFLRRALTTRSARLGENDPRTAEAQVRLGLCLAALGRVDEARSLVSAGEMKLRSEPYFKSTSQDAEQFASRLAPTGAR
ncbi:MAG TPA: serine/threonine-protein kinase [Vicinamibacterales bacterium]|jgi:serine/threonine-protein kinase|nr:serine/threonine-protein kinase [Vicinamibacterales bacterium]